MTSKERASYRAQANKLQAMFQVGKEGVSPAVAAQMHEAFRTRELLKGKVLLETSPQSPREAAEALAEMTGSQVVQVVGGSMVFFKVNEEMRRATAEQEKKKKAEVKQKAAEQRKVRAAKWKAPQK
jgi:RNA-binding protein